jgi:hypothetical protein
VESVQRLSRFPRGFLRVAKIGERREARYHPQAGDLV